MILNYYIGPKNSVMTDLYKNILRSFNNPSNHIIISSKYDEDEMINLGYKNIVIDDITSVQNLKLDIKLFKFIYRVYKKCIETKCTDVFILCENNWSIIFLYPIIKFLRLNFIIWIHDPELHSGERKKIKAARFIIDKFIIKNSKNIIVSYNEAKKIVSSKYNYKEEKIRTIFLPELPNMNYKDFETNNLRYDCIFYGRIEEYKGIDILIKAISIIKNKKNKKIKVCIVGRGKQSQEIWSLIEKLNLNVNIDFFNKYVEDYKLAELISQSKIVVLPYKDATGSQTVQIANYYKKIVVANKVGCFRDYIKNNVNGILIDEINEEKLAETICKVIDESYLSNFDYDKMQQFYRQNFSIKSFIFNLEKILN